MQGSPSSERARAALAVAAGAAIIGLAPIAVRVSDVGPMATAFWRFAFALPLLVLLVAVARPRLTLNAPVRAPLAAAGVCFGLDLTLWHAALTHTTVLNATLLSNMTPIFAVAGGFLFLRERITRAFAIGAAIAGIGAVLLTASRAQGGEGAWFGDALGVASAVWYAAYLVILRQVRDGADVRMAMLVTTAVSLVVASAAAALFGEDWTPHSATGWLVLMGLGLVHVGGQGLIAYGVARLNIALSTVLLWVQPVAAAGLSWAIFGEALGPLALVGAALVLGGIYVVQRGRA